MRRTPRISEAEWEVMKVLWRRWPQTANEIVDTKTTDSASTGTNLRLLLANMGIRNVIVTGIYTDQCVLSTVRSLADESFNVIVVDDCCAAGTDELHRKELESRS